MTARYGAYALALELGWTDVDAMLEGMTAMQYQEWRAFFKIRNEKESGPKQGYGTSQGEQQRMSGDLVRAMKGYQKRRDKAKGK